MEVTDNDNSIVIDRIQDTNNMITNGPFMNLTGKALGRDSGWNFRFTIAGFPFDKANVIAYDGVDDSSIRAFVGKDNGFAFLVMEVLLLLTKEFSPTTGLPNLGRLMELLLPFRILTDRW